MDEWMDDDGWIDGCWTVGLLDIARCLVLYIIPCRIEPQLVVYQSITNQLISAVLLTQEMLERQRAPTVAFDFQCWSDSFKGLQRLGYVCAFLLVFTADYCCLLIALSQLRTFIPMVTPIEAHCCLHQTPSPPMGPPRNELKNWAMRFSEQICQWASRVTWVGRAALEDSSG